jgi:hypothetical protein
MTIMSLTILYSLKRLVTASIRRLIWTFNLKNKFCFPKLITIFRNKKLRLYKKHQMKSWHSLSRNSLLKERHLFLLLCAFDRKELTRSS